MKCNLTTFILTPAKEALRKFSDRAKKELQQHAACFETRSSGAPQHEVILLMALGKILILRCLAERGLEERTTLIQTIGNFLTAAKAGVAGLDSLPGRPALAGRSGDRGND
jgi:hypothetical protein